MVRRTYHLPAAATPRGCATHVLRPFAGEFASEFEV